MNVKTLLDYKVHSNQKFISFSKNDYAYVIHIYKLSRFYKRFESKVWSELFETHNNNFKTELLRIL